MVPLAEELGVAEGDDESDWDLVKEADAECDLVAESVSE